MRSRGEGGPSAESEQLTKLTLGLRGRLRDYACRLEAVVGGAEGVSFTGEVDVNSGLGDFLKKTLSQAAQDAAIADVFPELKLPLLELSYNSASAALLLRLSKFEIALPTGWPITKLDLDFAFGRLTAKNAEEGKPASSLYIAGIRALTRERLELGRLSGSDIAAKLLGDLGISHLGVYYATEKVAESVALFDGDGPGSAFAKGFSFSARFGTKDSYTDIALPPPDGQAAPPLPPPETTRARTEPGSGAERGAAAEQPATSTAVGLGGGDNRLRKWIEVQKTFGPLELRRIGGEWHDGKLGFLLDAGVELLGLKVALAGLRVSVAPAKLTSLKLEDLEFGLDGLEIGFKGGPISISGAFLKTPDGGFAGTALIRAEMFAIAAMGAYSQTTAGNPSLFIYGAYVGVIGGPPCFVVQGLAAGFGYNRGLTVPPVEEVHKFPLVSLVMSAGGSASPRTGSGSGGSSSMLAQLSGPDHFPVREGQYWLAAGIKFTSFKLIDAFALLTVQFGVRFELALLGVATMQQPPKVGGVEPEPFALVELALSVRFAPDDGLFAARAVLTSNSYLFDPQCKLTGGFAFCIWFKPTDPKFPDHSGDFVLTLGGYHPRFQVPDHYPRVPRVGFNWQRPDLGVTIKGESYFALTPSCMMAGCRLSAIYSSGDFRAWFEANADFLMAWAPFHYEADIGLWIGASYTTRVGEITSVISFQIGASLSIWGPEFAGIAYVDLGIAAFTVHIGAENVSRTPVPITWDKFCGRFIPHVDDKAAPLSVTVIGGLLREDKKEGQKEGQIFVNPSELGLSIETYIPVTKLQFNDKALDYSGTQIDGKPIKTSFGIRPLAVTAIDSELRIRFEKDGKAYPPESQPNPLECQPIIKGLPEALWSPKKAPSAEEPIRADVISNALSGVRLFIAQQRGPKNAEASPGIVDVSSATAKHAPLTLDHAKDKDKSFSEFGKILHDNSAQRTNLVAALQALKFDLAPETMDHEQLADRAEKEDLLTAVPAFVALGQLPPLPEEKRA
jgi:hypothetical protein